MHYNSVNVSKHPAQQPGALRPRAGQRAAGEIRELGGAEESQSGLLVEPESDTNDFAAVEARGQVLVVRAQVDPRAHAANTRMERRKHLRDGV